MAPALPIRETLAEIADPAHSALLVIDVQEDFCRADCQAMLPQLERLIAAARAGGVYVVYVQNDTPADGSTTSPAEISRRRRFGRDWRVTLVGTPGHAFVEQVAPLPTDPVVHKHRMSSFAGTDLDRLLRCRGIETLICTGVATNGCVLNTAFAAIALDYYVVVVEDCVATGQRDLHDSALYLLRNSVHYTVPAAQLAALWAAPVGAGAAVAEAVG
jgi:nicotinamidase-related amidase